MSLPPPEPLDPALEKLVAEEQRAQDLPSGASERLQARLAPLFAGPASAPTAPQAPSASAAGTKAIATATRALRVAKYVAVLVVGSVLGAGVQAAFTRAPPVAIVYVDRAVVPSASGVSPSAIAAPWASSSAPAPVVAPGPTARSAGAPATTVPLATEAAARDLAAEQVGLEIARAALARGDSSAALAATDRYARSFPRGQLREEADAIAVQALARAGRLDEARARAAQFRRSYPHGLFRAVVDQAAP
jgi:hypothetical protein